jgi:adenylate cyclase
MKRRASRDVIGLTAILAGAALWLLFLCAPYIDGQEGPTDAFEYRLLNLRHRLVGPVEAAPNVALVAIDDATLAAESAQGLSRRALLARVIDHIARSDAQALAVDVLLTDSGDPEENAVLASALSSRPAVIAAALSFAGGEVAKIWPQSVFAASAEPGLVNLSTDSNGTPRYVPLLVTVGQETFPSLTLLSALAGTGDSASFGASRLEIGERSIPLDVGMNMPLRYLGPSGTIQTLSARAVLDRPDPARLSGKIVVLGFSAAAMGDRFATPFDDSMPGMEVIATAISQLSGGTTLRRDQMVRKWDVVHAVSLTVLGLLALVLLPLSRGALTVVVLLCSSLASATALFSLGIWLSAALPLAAAGLPFLSMALLRYRRERVQARHSARAVASLRRFQSPMLTARLEQDPNYLSEPQEENLVILFADLTGFTGLSQRLGTAGTRQLLQVFHKLCDTSVETRKGSVFNYMGDGIIAVFGMDAAPERAAEDALNAAFDLALELSQTRLPSLPEEVLHCRIGLHRGPATLSRLGGDRHQQVTVSGDTVNFSSRLMEVAKEEAATLVCSKILFDDLEADPLALGARMADVQIRGRAGQEQVYIWSQAALNGIAR